MIERNKYLQQLIKSKNNGFPKVITGLRRCGKSYLLDEIYFRYLLSLGVENDHILLLNLDEAANSKYRDPFELDSYIKSWSSGKENCYVMIDEIQKVWTLVNPLLTQGKHVLARKEDKETVGFVDVILGLSRLKNLDVYITGSNSKMLSSDIITEFRDKATNIHMQPLSFEEFFAYTKGSFDEAIDEYLRYGGMPLAILKEEGDKKTYLKDLFKTTYFQDILDRNHIRRSDALDELANLLAESSGQLLNSAKLATLYKNQAKKEMQDTTLQRYISLFEDAYLLSEARRYDIKGKKEIGSLKKYYFSDLGLRNARLDFAFPDYGALLETLVYNELIYHGYSVSVGVFDSFSKNKEGITIRKSMEVDFKAIKNSRRLYIQVCSDFSERKTQERETKPFSYINDEYTKIVVAKTFHGIARDEQGHLIVGLEDFLLHFLDQDEF